MRSEHARSAAPRAIWAACQLALLCWPAALASAAALEPRRVAVPLREYTALNVVLVPDLGTRFSFPFALDEADASVPFTLNMTNPIFIHHREPGRKFFTVEIDPQDSERGARYLGNLFVTVGRYNLSIALSSSLDTREHVTDYAFLLTGEARKQRLQEAVDQRVAALEQRYQARLAELDRRVHELALARLAELASQPVSNRAIRERGVLRTPQGQVALRLDRMKRYGKRFYVFHYRLRNETASPLSVQHAVLSLIDAKGQSRPVAGAHAPPQTVPAGQRRAGRYATDDSAVEDPRYHLALRVQTDLGEVTAEW